ncbi:hypothetical protein [Arthrobacter sp. 135MFCol5.1]|uniref:hypothetical protein n=1 Tax=Arthrobacter sp. 135MFCol5.1 TaxID=1158050 RepID=UPI0012DD1225|nr:hypothetical protein [Arthrobacter sp. 135MFCol5.1]
MNHEAPGTLLDGPSAYAFANARTTYTKSFLILPVTGALLSFFDLWIQWVMTSLTILTMITIGPLLYLIMAAFNRDSAEVEAGYTTIPTNHIDLEQRDPYMGRVIRKPGEQYLDPNRFKEIVSRARAESKETP